MNRTDLYNSFQHVDDDILARSEYPALPAGFSMRRLLPLAAALLAVLLMGAGTVALVYGDSMQNWMAHRWESLTGQPMSEDHSTLIDHLSQEIGLRETVGTVTVTADSATVGDDSFFLLLRVTGLPFSPRCSYGFDRLFLEITPDPLNDAGGIRGFGAAFQGLDGDGAALFLIDYDYALNTGYLADDRPLTVTMFLTDLMENPSSDQANLLAEGTWNFQFTLERNLPKEVSLPDTQVMAFDLTETETYTEVPVTLTNIQLTNTGVRFQYDDFEGTRSVDAHIFAILSSGQEVGIESGTGTRMDDGTLFCIYSWLVPVNLEEVTAVRIGGVEIPVP